MNSVGIVGGGIVGLALARQLSIARPGLAVTLFEKESAVGLHQTSHNSGVVHAGVYYRPGSLKATLCRRGSEMMREFCQSEGLPFDPIGKLIIATDEVDRVRLDDLEARARANGVPGLRRLGADELAEIEPGVAGVSALLSPASAITDFSAVARRLREILVEGGHEVRVGQRVERVVEVGSTAAVEVNGERFSFDRVVVCAGLGTAKLLAADRATFAPEPLSIPFRGEYYRLTPAARSVVSHLVYPVPDPKYPFLGVHFTPRVDGEVLIGPNAVLAWAMEGYRMSTVSISDLRRMLAAAGFWRMAASNWRTGIYELAGSLSRRRYVERARRYVPSLQLADVVRAPAGVRAQAVANDGTFLDDIVLEEHGSVVVLRNAPSPAATSSLALAEHLVGAMAL